MSALTTVQVVTHICMYDWPAVHDDDDPADAADAADDEDDAEDDDEEEDDDDDDDDDDAAADDDAEDADDEDDDEDGLKVKCYEKSLHGTHEKINEKKHAMGFCAACDEM